MNDAQDKLGEVTLTPKQKEDFAKTILKGIQTDLQELASLHAPYWDARNDLLKTLIQLASGSIVLTITFANALLKTEVGKWKFFLFASWICFLISIIGSVMSLRLSINIRTVPTSMGGHKTDRIIRNVDKIDFNNLDALTERLTKALMADVPKWDRSERWVTRFSNAGLLFFVIALLLLGVFGWRMLAA